MINCVIKPGFHIIVQIIPIAPVISNNFRVIRPVVQKHYLDHCKGAISLDDLDRLDRIEFYPDD